MITRRFFNAAIPALALAKLADAQTPPDPPPNRLTALSLGLIIGGAVGNAIDRLAYGWVADFVFFH